MGRRFGNLQDKEIIACYVSAYRENGLDDVVFEKNIAQMKIQKAEETIQLSTELEKLEVCSKINDKDFFRQAAIYCLSNERNCTMKQAEEIYTKVEQEREAEDKSDYGKILKALQAPKYDSSKPESKVEKTHEEPQREEPQGEVEWIRSGTVKLELLKKKYQRR